MMRRVAIPICLLILVANSVLVFAQANSLPSDLIFTAVERVQVMGAYITTLVRLDANTLKMMPFYADSKASQNGLRALKWSPDGSLLAIYRSEHTDVNNPMRNGYTYQICTLTRSGSLTACSKDQPMYYTGGGIGDQLSAVSWSSDSKSIYFATETDSSVRIVEMNAQTGETQRSIVEYPKDKSEDLPPFLGWDPKLNYVTVGIGEEQRARHKISQPVINLQINQTNTVARQSADLISSVPTQVKLRLICINFSPNGNYLVAIDQVGIDSVNMTILGRNGETVQSLASINYGTFKRIDCPTWQPGEMAFYFMGSVKEDRRAQVFRFSLSDQQISVLYRIPNMTDLDQGDKTGVLDSPLVLSPDGKLIAAVSLDNPNPAGVVQVAILYPDGKIRNFLAPYYSTSNPVWVPPSIP